MAQLGDGTQSAIVAGSGDGGEKLLVVNFSGEETASLELPQLEVDHVDDLAIAPTVRWAAVAMRGGLIHVVDLDSTQLVARVTDQGARPQVAWLPRKDQSPLLIVATGKELNAFEVTPTDLTKDSDAATGAVQQAEFTEQSETPADAESTP
jgi:hypothetical protein